MNRRRRFLAKRKRSVSKALADAASAKHLGREDRDIIQAYWSELQRHGACHITTFSHIEVITAVRDR